MVLGMEQQEAATAFGAWKYLGNIVIALVLMLPTFDEHHQFRNNKQKNRIILNPFSSGHSFQRGLF